ncbi:hypothetical protein SUGI_0906660 [Cryptomeria japonica]|nr:hypothetical protein SUGI_0906660 [Cryptomeria japonica]
MMLHSCDVCSFQSNCTQPSNSSDLGLVSRSLEILIPKGISTGSSGGDGYDAGFEDIEKYHQRMLSENPINSVILRNYA